MKEKTPMVRIRFTRYAKLKYDSVLDYTYNEFGATTECEFEADFLKVSKPCNGWFLYFSGSLSPLIKIDTTSSNKDLS